MTMTDPTGSSHSHGQRSIPLLYQDLNPAAAALSLEEEVQKNVLLTSVDGLFAARSFQIQPKDVVLATESPVTKVNSIFNLLGASLGIANRL